MLTMPAAAGAPAFEQTPPNPVLAGDAFRLSIYGLPPDSEVEVQAQRNVREFTGQMRAYASHATYRSDAHGRVDLAHAAPLEGGSYHGADALGLLWSMTPVPSAAAKEVPPPETEVRLEALVGGRSVASHVLQLQRALPQVQSTAAAPFPGAVYAALPGTVKRPALILLGGSEGGSHITRGAAPWASRGFAVLALPYYSPEGWGPKGPTPPELPSLPPAFADIPLDRLQQAREWLVQQPQVDASRIGVVGTSKGAEFALAAASRMPWIKAVVAIVPSDVIWEGWGPGVTDGRWSSFSWHGKSLPFVPYKDFAKEMAGFTTGAAVHIRHPQDAGRAAHPERAAAARIRVEDIAAPLLVAGSDDDQMWDSGGMAAAIVGTRKQAGLETVAFIYPKAGHVLGGSGTAPTTQYDAGPMKLGGTPVANAHAQAEVFTGTLRFLQRTLGPMPK